jgi:hypothetical protein
MEPHALRNVNNCSNNKIISCLETSGGQNYNLYLNVVHLFYTSVNKTSAAAQESCFPALVNNTRCSFLVNFHQDFVASMQSGFFQE